MTDSSSSPVHKVALITGGARGIGFGIAEALLADGYQVIVTGLTFDEVATVPLRKNLSTHQLDVTDDASVQALIQNYDRLDVLINCAGVIIRGGAEYDIEQFKKVIDVNLTGTMRMCMAAKPKLTHSNNGVIINTASMLSIFGGPLTPAYSASKGGVVQLTKSLAVAWAEDGIRVNAIAPGWIETELTKGAREDPVRTKAIIDRTPMKRWGMPNDIGGVVAHLCSDASRFITGAIIPIDGGYSAV
jgi:short-subunit dehydrogenase